MLSISKKYFPLFFFAFLFTFLFSHSSFAGVPPPMGEPGIEVITMDTTLTENVVDTGYLINANNVDFDCDGYSISADGANIPAIEVAEGVRNATIKNCYISGFEIGVKVGNDARRTRIMDNMIEDFCLYGIVLNEGSRNANVNNNILTNYESPSCGEAFTKGGYSNVGILLDLSTNNTVELNHIAYTEVGIKIYSSSFNKVRDNNIHATSYSGIYMDSGGEEIVVSRKNDILNNLIAANEYFGIYVEESNQNSFLRNVLYNNGGENEYFECEWESESCFPPPFPFLELCFDSEYGPEIGESELSTIFIAESDSNLFEDNVIGQNCGAGIGVVESSNNRFLTNDISSNLAGILLYYVNGGRSVQNSIFSNFFVGIAFDDLTGSLISGNKVMSNGITDDMYPELIGGIIQFFEDEGSEGNTIRNNDSRANSFCDLFVDTSENNVFNNTTLFENEECLFFIEDD